jgi:hypothetical protein
MNVRFGTTIDFGGEEIDVTVKADCSAGDPGCRYTKNGDGWPPTSPTAEILSVVNDSNGIDISEKLSDDDMRRLEDMALEAADDDFLSGADEAADAKRGDYGY